MSKGRVTIPTDTDIIEETKEIIKKLGADALRDCDGTEFPKELKDSGVKIYATYYTTRKDNKWAKQNPDEIQQCYIMTDFFMACSNEIRIPISKGLSKELILPNVNDNIKRWWEVIDRTSNEIIAEWDFDKIKEEVIISNCIPYHEYTVSFLAYLIWDPVHMYNSIVNGWKDSEHQMTFDVRQPKTKEFSKKRLKDFIAAHPYVNVIRFTTFFHQFTLLFDELKREKYVDWYGYSASVSPYILEQFEKEVGYKFRPEYIIDEGYYANQYRIPSKEFKDFQKFQQREVAKLAKEFVDITHEMGCEAMMFLGDHWIGTEPFMEDFKKIGLDALVGSVASGVTLRLISDVDGVKYREGRYMPYFFPDVFCETGNPLKEAKEGWVTSRRAMLRKPIDRIGYGGYLKLALKFPEFIDYITDVCNEFRKLYDNISGTVPYNAKSVAILNSWGKIRSWGCHMVHHGLYFKKNYSYSGILEALSGLPFDVSFISFDDIREDPHILNEIDIIINLGDADTAHTGGENWIDEKIITSIRNFIYNGGGFIGIGEPSAHQYNGRFFQLASCLGVEKETGFTLNYDKYNWEEREHFITEDCTLPIDFGEGQKEIYAFENTEVICVTETPYKPIANQYIKKTWNVQLAANQYGKGRTVYISGLPYSYENSRLLHRALLWSSRGEDKLKKWFSDNINVEVHAYIENNKFCVVNNTYETQKTTVYKGDGSSFDVSLKENEIIWYPIFL